METIRRVPIVQQVVSSIKEYIFSNAVQEGDKLPTEKQLCENLGVGRGTIREALRILEATGFVEFKPGRGAFVLRTKEIDTEDIIEWFSEHEVEVKDFNEVRLAIEPLAVKLAIQRCTDEDIANIVQIHKKFVNAIKANDISQIVIYDEEFHNAIVEYSRNKLLISINKKINSFLKDFRCKTFFIPENAQNAISPHQEVLNAFINRNVEDGEKSIIQHLKYVEKDLLKSKNIYDIK
jgi:GntR family transcriptional repressor for pyruvate dehydrogenase complex